LTLSRAILITILSIHCALVLTQAVLAGQFLAGSDSQVTFHELTGWIVLGISAAQILLTAVFISSRVSSLWLLFGSIFLFLGEALQVGTGYGRFLGVHIPLGAIILATVVGQTSAVLMKRSASGGTPE
jgi:hypothetical protein